MKKAVIMAGLVVITGIIWSCERNNSNGTLAISVTSDMICKSNGLLKTQGTPLENSCINYTYYGDSLLSLKHINASFNCCPEKFLVEIEVKGDSLIIHEDELKHGCRCNCVFDLDISVRNLPADKYHVRIVEPYVNNTWPRLIFDLDLKKTTTGQYCVTRPEGWWR